MHLHGGVELWVDWIDEKQRSLGGLRKETTIEEKNFVARQEKGRGRRWV